MCIKIDECNCRIHNDCYNYYYRVGDVATEGNKFTWYSLDGKSMSRLDMFFLFEELISKWNISCQHVSLKDISNHAFVWFKGRNLNWSPKPFKFSNGWLDNYELVPLIKDFWESTIVEGKVAFVLKEKLRLLRSVLRKLNKDVFGVINLEVDSVVKDLNQLDNLDAIDGEVEESSDGVDFVRLRWEATRKVWKSLHNRSIWIKEGDRNIKFFHNSLRVRIRRNNIVGLNTCRGRLKQVHEVKAEFKRHFECRFTETNYVRPMLDGVSFRQLYLEYKAFLEEPFALDEIKEVMWSGDKDKTLGSDGFNLGFFKVCWDFLKDDYLDLLRSFMNVVGC